MTPYQKRLTDVVLRLAGDLKIRNRAQATIDAYTYHVQRFADFTKSRWTGRLRKTLETSSCI